MKQKEFSSWLKLIVIICAVFGIIFCSFVFPRFSNEMIAMNPSLSAIYIPSIIFICITALPFYAALILSWLICNDISHDKSFTSKNAKRLKIISKLAVSESVLYILACIIMVLLNLYHINILIVAMMIIFAGIVIAVVSAALSHLVENASELKENNDLTI